MENQFNVLQDYLANPIHSSLLDMGIAPSYFLHHFDDIFCDEDIFNKYGQIDTCFSCLSNDINFEIISKDEILSFLRNETNYSYEERKKISNDIFSLIEMYDVKDKIEIYYCKNCKRIIALYGIPYVFYFDELQRLNYEQYKILETEGTIGKDNWADVRMCPRCHSYDIKHKDVSYDETGEVEFSCFCKKCNYYIGYFSYGSAEYPHPIQEEIFQKVFEANKYEPKWDFDDELPFN